MIASRADLKRYLEMDAKALGVDAKRITLLENEVWRFQKSLRFYEYALNTKAPKLVKLYRKCVYRYWGIKLGFIIPANVFGGCE